MLYKQYLEIVREWRLVFAQDRTFIRAVRQSVAVFCSMGRRTISRALCCMGLDQQDWSAEYRLHSRSEWKSDDLFKPIVRRAHPLCGQKYVVVAYDSGHLRKTGRKIPGTSYWADPLSPKFRVNFMWGSRYLQASLLVPHYRTSSQPARGLPVQFTEVPATKRPGKRSTEEEREAYKLAVKEKNLSTAFVKELNSLRAVLDSKDVGAKDKVMIAALDGGFCNRACMSADLDRVILVARTRKDAKLCFPAPKGGQRVYDTLKFTPESVRLDESIAWKTALIFHGGEWRSVRYKEVGPVLWQGGTKRKPIRLFVIAPTPYRTSRNTSLNYRQPAYLLCTDCNVDAVTILQAYFDRWQIEVNHREQKDTLGVGQAQVWSKKSVPRQPALMVAAYSALLLASIEVFGPGRTNDYMPLPKWRKNAQRPSLQDLITVLRKEITAEPDYTDEFGIKASLKDMVFKAAA